MSSYQGMRWLKCDLQMHTPADPQNWQGGRIAGNWHEQYARACYEAGLDAVAITDHNLLSKSALPDLVKAFAALASEFRRGITVFPGFEFEADVGKGMHVVCVFEPGTCPDRLDHLLTECGVGQPRSTGGNFTKSTKRLPEIVEIVQRPDPTGRQQGVVIVPHVFEDSLFDNDRISDWLQREEYLNPDLLAAEVPKPVTQMGPNFQRLFRAGADCQSEWRRRRPLALIMSSDAKSCDKATDGRRATNSIGCRYTWIKMSEPSIESLRQAFLDGESRIRIPDDISRDVRPSDRERHARVLSVSFSNAAFLSDQSIVFSPNLNCIIGGRGSGKSTIVEGMRLAMGKDDDPTIDTSTTGKINRIRDLLARNAGTKVELRWQDADGLVDTLEFVDGECRVAGRNMVDLRSYLRDIPVQFFSQQQLNQLTTGSGNMLLSLLDDFARDALKSLQQRETEVRGEIQQVLTTRGTLEQVCEAVSRIEQEAAELDRQWQARASLQEEALRHQGLKAQADYMQRVKAGLKDDGDRLTTAAEDIADTHSPLGSVADKWPDGPWFKSKDDAILAAKEALQVDVTEAVERYRRVVRELFSLDGQWAVLEKSMETADAEFVAACRKRGIAPEDVSRVQEISQKRLAKQQELKAKISERERLATISAKLPQLLNTLHGIWWDCYQTRRSVAEEVNESAKTGDEPVIELSVHFGGERNAFMESWANLCKDRRPRLGRNWQDIGGAVHDAFLAKSGLSRSAQDSTGCRSELPEPASAWAMVETWMDGVADVPASVAATLEDAQVSFADLRAHLRGEDQKAWQEARLMRVEDSVDLVLYRADGSGVAGRVSDGSLSDGQRNTAVLAVLLAKSEAPLVLDQPEDELDSNFIFRELVPMLRRLKSSRQLILVTHNANLPVNGDAELVYALTTRDGHGVRCAEGGLDRADVTEAVLEIMEGSELAFQRRREKYHF